MAFVGALRTFGATVPLTLVLGFSMKSELRQMLLAPSAVGLIVGLFVGWADYGFNMEYGQSIHPDWQPLWLYSLLHAALDGLAAFLGIIVVFGLLPFIVLRQFRKKSP